MFSALLASSLALIPQQQTQQSKIEWQRSLEDALAEQKRTGKPLLVVANRDGEVFCDRFADTTYRDPAFVELTRGYVCVLGSTDRHNDRDYDGLGRRIECPRFPGCTCSEHINMEPLLFERWFGGQRTAPRHIAVAKDGKVLFDRFLDRSMQQAIDLIEQHRDDPGTQKLPDSFEALLKLRSAAARDEIDRRYVAADAEDRRAMLRTAARATNEPFDLLRMGLRSDDEATFRSAAEALVATATTSAWIDVADAIARCDDGELRAPLEKILTRVVTGDEFAELFLAHRKAALSAIERGSKPPFGLPATEAAEPNEPATREQLEARIDAAERALKAAGKDDANALLELAQANLDLAMLLLPSGGSIVPLLFEDARRGGERAEQAASATAQDFRALTIQCIALWQLSRPAESGVKGSRALDLAATLGEACDSSTVEFAALCRAAGRAAASRAYAAVSADPRAKVAADVRAAALPFHTLARHPHATAEDVRQAAELFGFGGARRRAQAILDAGIERFPYDRELHRVLRDRLAIDRGAEGLREWYQRHVAASNDKATAEWYAGFAAIVAAEMHVKDQRKELAEAAYTECIERFARSAETNASYADSANHVAVLALAGRALLRYERGEAERAVDDLVSAQQMRPASMQETDGLGRRPEAVVGRLRRELREQGREDLAERLPR